MILERVSQFISMFNTAWGGSLRTMPGAAQMARYTPEIGAPVSSMSLQMKSMETSAVVHTAISLVGESFAGVPLYVYFGSKRRRMEDHAFTRLLDQPNPLMSGFELMEKTAQYIEATGNAYWFYEPDANGQPKEIWLLRPDRVAIIPDQKNLIWGYMYNYDGYNVRIPGAQITHFKRPHLIDDWFGLSALTAAWLDILGEEAMRRFNYGFFAKKVAKADGILILPSTTNDAQFDAAKETIQVQYGESRGTMIIRAPTADERPEFFPTNINQKDMEYIGGRNFVRQLVLELLGIPTGMMSEASTEAHARVAERRFLDRIYKRHLRVAGKLEIDALPLYGHNLYAAFKDVRIADAEQLLKRMQALKGIATGNEMRGEVGLEEIEGGDELLAAQQPQEESGAENDGDQPQGASDSRTYGVKEELKAFWRYASRRVGHNLDGFEFHVLGRDTQKAIRAACEGADRETINRSFAAFLGRTKDELVR